MRVEVTTVFDPVKIASEQASGWLEMWRLFALVVLAVVAATLAYSDVENPVLPDGFRTIVMIAFILFSLMHGITMIRYYHMFNKILTMTTGPDEIVLVKALAPPQQWYVVGILYAIFVLMVICFLFVVGQPN